MLLLSLLLRLLRWRRVGGRSASGSQSSASGAGPTSYPAQPEEESLPENGRSRATCVVTRVDRTVQVKSAANDADQGEAESAGGRGPAKENPSREKGETPTAPPISFLRHPFPGDRHADALRISALQAGVRFRVGIRTGRSENRF